MRESSEPCNRESDTTPSYIHTAANTCFLIKRRKTLKKDWRKRHNNTRGNEEWTKKGKEDVNPLVRSVRRHFYGVGVVFRNSFLHQQHGTSNVAGGASCPRSQPRLRRCGRLCWRDERKDVGRSTRLQSEESMEDINGGWQDSNEITKM